MHTDEIVVIDYGVGNIASIMNMLQFVGAKGNFTRDPETIRNAAKIILPGIGTFQAGMTSLRNYDLEEPIKIALKNGAYILGICLGYQLLFEESEEWPGGTGLGLVQGKVKKFSCEDQGLRVPHVGWNEIIPTEGARLFDSDEEELRYYFVHSYYTECKDSSMIAALCNYGHDFTCAIEMDRLFGVQFHPEKSHRFGVSTFTKFVELQC